MLNRHPRIEAFDQLKLLTGSAAAQGFRLPAEWEPVEAIWTVLPHNAETWPGCLPEAAAQHAAWREAMAAYVKVETVQAHGIATFDSWLRDFGPLWVVNDQTGQLALHDFFFNSWGGKYEGQRLLDNLVPQEIAQRHGTPLWVHDFVLEGGSMDVNGQGLLLTTEQCLFDGSRNPWLQREQIEQYLCDAFAIDKIMWLPGGIAGDDTDGHIDDIARFVAPDRVVCVSAPEGHPDHAVCQRNLEALATMRDVLGSKLEIIELPVPEPMYWDFPAEDHHAGGGRQPLPASYANFVMANGTLFMPAFGQSADDAAARVLEAASGMNVVPIRAEHLVVGLGALHCLSMQQPAAPARMGAA